MLPVITAEAVSEYESYYEQSCSAAVCYQSVSRQLQVYFCFDRLGDNTVIILIPPCQTHSTFPMHKKLIFFLHVSFSHFTCLQTCYVPVGISFLTESSA